MPVTATLYPTEDLYIIKQMPGTESLAAAELRGDTIYNGSDTLIAGTNFDGTQTVWRTYMAFDMRSLNVASLDSVTLTVVTTGGDKGFMYAMYAGSGSLNNIDDQQYSLYRRNGTPNVGSPDIIPWVGETEINPAVGTYTFNLDLARYPILPAQLFIVALITANDLYQTIGTYSQESHSIAAVESMSTRNRPYVTITYTEGATGYANQIMGVTATSVMGVPAANITNIMGV